MSVSVTGYSGVRTDGQTSSTSVAIPVQAVSGDILLIAATSERPEIPTVTVGGTTTGINTGRSQSTTNLSVAFVWKRLASSDLGAQVTMANTGHRSQALAVMLVRGSGDPTFKNGVFIGAYSGVYTATGPTISPSVDNAVLVGMWGTDCPNAPYTGYSFTTSWTERVEEDGIANGINPTAFLSTKLLGTGTANVSQAGEVLTISPSEKFESLPTVVEFDPATTLIPPSVAVNQSIGAGIIDARGSSGSNGGTLAFGISPAATAITDGCWYAQPGTSDVTYTVTGTETTQSGSSSATASTTVAKLTTATSGIFTKTRVAGAWA